MLPRAKKLDQARKPVRKLTLKKNDLGLKEAKKKKPDLSSTLIDDATWDNILKGYKEDYQTPHNPRDFIVGGKLQDELDDALVYSWEVDQDLTDEFMRQVNDSQEAAFEKAGLTKFVWIAVLDNRTCQECCVWRDGLTIEEIEAALKSGRKGDKCQSLKPPAHPNCRCTLAPAFDNLPERPNSNLKEFEEWLED